MECDDVRLNQTLKKIQAAGLTLNKDKCVFSKTSMKFLCQIIDSHLLMIIYIKPERDACICDNILTIWWVSGIPL